MITVKLGRYQKGRLWLNSLPELRYPVIEVIERVLDAENLTAVEVRRGGIELFLPTGARALYGLLGAEFTPSNTGLLVVQVAISTDAALVFKKSLAFAVDDVYVGLPREYAEDVLNGACIEPNIRLLGSGVLRFDRAAHGQAGSSRSFFRRLSSAVVRLLSSNMDSGSEDELAMFLQLQNE